MKNIKYSIRWKFIIYIVYQLPQYIKFWAFVLDKFLKQTICIRLEYRKNDSCSIKHANPIKHN